MKWQRDWEAEEAAKATMSHAQRLAEMDAKRAAAEADADALRHELAKAREAMLSGRGREEEMARLAQEELDREREKRVQHLQQLGVRRLIQQGLARGWTTWVDGYRDLQRKRRLLAAAAGRLSKPKLVAAFVHWQHDWEVEEAAKAALLEKTTSEERAEQERILREALENNVKLLQMELAEARAAALAGVGQEAELKRLMQQKLEEERQKRIEHLHGSAIRRMLYADIARGWSAWLTFWDEKSRHLRMLRSASSKMTKPKLSAAFAHWHRDWELEQVVKEGMTTQQKYEHQLAMQRAVEATLQDQIFKLKTELMAAREAALAGDGREAEVERLHKLALEQEKEKRVAHLQQMGVRRLLQQGLARGWTAWMDTYREYKHNQFLLRGAANRFARPKLVAAWGRWQRDWDAAIAAREKEAAFSAGQRELEEKLTESQEKRASLEDQLLQVKLELVAAREAARAGLGQEAEYQRLLEQKMEEERDRRLAHLQRVGANRVAQIDVSRAWNTWRDQHHALSETRRLVRSAVARLLRPKVAASFRHWHADWSHDTRSKRDKEASDEADKKVLEEIKKREALELHLRKVRVDNEQQAELNRVALAEARQAAMDALARAALEKTSADEARKGAKDAAEVVRVANQSAEQANKLLEQQQATASAQLAQLLAEQRAQLTQEIVKLREEYEKIIASLRAKLEDAASKKATPPPEPSPAPAPAAAPAVKHGRFHITYDPNKSIVQQLREQVLDKGLRVLDLFRELDEDKDGCINKKDWRKGMKKIGPDVPDDVLDAAFDEADPDNSNTIEFQELENFLKNRKRSLVVAPPEKKSRIVKRVKPSLLAALATSMGVKGNLLQASVDDADKIGAGEKDFFELMKERAAAFQKADMDFDGKLDFEEYKAMVKYREVKEYTEQELKAKFDSLDADKSGKIDQYEFISYSLRDALQKSKGKALDIFRVWDEDNSGQIDRKEFTKSIVALGFCCSQKDSDAVFDMLDEDGSGTIDLKELSTMLRGRRPSTAALPVRGGPTPPSAPGKSGSTSNVGPRASRMKDAAKK